VIGINPPSIGTTWILCNFKVGINIKFFPEQMSQLKIQLMCADNSSGYQLEGQHICYIRFWNGFKKTINAKNNYKIIFEM